MVIRRILLCVVFVMTGSVVLADSWSPISIVDAPTARAAHSAVFTRIEGTDQMIVWGGQDSPMTPFANTGARWKRSTNVWAATTTTNASLTGAPDGRFGHSFIWTGDRLIVWGGAVGFGGDVNTGAIYDPVADSWSSTTTVGAPSARDGQASIWTGSQMLIWGGISLGNYVNDGAFYDPRTDAWTPISTTNAPSPRLFFAAGWDSTNLFIWGGVDSRFRPLANGKLYNTVTGLWRTITLSGRAKSSSSGVAPMRTETPSGLEPNTTPPPTGGQR